MTAETYERIKGLLEDYYKSRSSSIQGGIEERLEEYSLNGREILKLIDEVVELQDFTHPSVIELNKIKEEIRDITKKLKEISK